VTIQDIGAIGELIAAIATVVTLLYLAAQIRQSHRVVVASMADSARDAQSDLARILGSNAEAARVFHAGRQDPGSLSGGELQQFEALAHLSLINIERRYVHESASDIDEAATWLFSNPGIHEYFELYSQTFTPKFRNHVARLLAGMQDGGQ